MKEARLVNVQHFCIDDGPGMRTTVFFKGCNLRCIWCHNPESQSRIPDLFFYENKCIGCGTCKSICPQKELFSVDCIHCGMCAENCNAEAIEFCGRQVTIEELMEEILEDEDVYARSGGGVTFSGGEPVLQSEFLLEVLKCCKDKGIHTAIETAGCYEYALLERLLPYLGLVFCDIKSLDEAKHKKYTGVSNKQILENIKRLSVDAKRLILRTPVAKGFNAEEMEDIASFVAGLPKKPEVELLAFHSMCESKYRALRREFEACNFITPSVEEMKKYEEFFTKEGIVCKS